jgi:hypothetical protein
LKDLELEFDEMIGIGSNSALGIISSPIKTLNDEKEDNDTLKTLIDKVDALTSMVQILTAKFEEKMSKSSLEP